VVLDIYNHTLLTVNDKNTQKKHFTRDVHVCTILQQTLPGIESDILLQDMIYFSKLTSQTINCDY
jgi:hypothetical protein